MSRRMSCSMTIDAVKSRQKTVTRRHVDTWQTLKPGDRLTLIEKGMGLAKGEKQVVLAEVEIISVRVELLYWSGVELEREGFPYLTRQEFWRMWADAHGCRSTPDDRLYELRCRRIEWRYLTEGEAP